MASIPAVADSPDIARKVNRPLALTVDAVERGIVIALAAPFFLAFSSELPRHPYWLLLAVCEGLNVLFILVRRPGQVAIAPYPVTVALLGTALSLLVRPSSGAQLIPLWLSVFAMFSGLGLSILSKIVLNRRFGILPANRGIASWGPYRLVRHPMYLGYIIAQAGFLLTDFTLRTAVIYALAWFFQILRIGEEEKLLMKDADYRAFAAGTRWRLIPGLF